MHGLGCEVLDVAVAQSSTGVCQRNGDPADAVFSPVTCRWLTTNKHGFGCRVLSHSRITNHFLPWSKQAKGPGSLHLT
uniref:Polyketide synthase n=1 Tax=Peronospora matthiolae TaxID=2874970 RepID=A0AAV1UK06_9STRA